MAAVSLLVSALLLLSPAAAELQRVQHAPKDDGSLTVLAVGDWGRGGQFNQTIVAEQVYVKTSPSHVCGLLLREILLELRHHQ
jgi:hypothetical protein